MKTYIVSYVRHRFDSSGIGHLEPRLYGIKARTLKEAVRRVRNGFTLARGVEALSEKWVSPGAIMSVESKDTQ